MFWPISWDWERRCTTEESPMYWMQRNDPNPPVEYRPSAPAPFSPKETIDYQDYWRPIRNHLPLLIAIFIIVELLSLVVLLTRPKIYTSSSTILIEREAPEVLESTRPNEEAQSGAETFYTTQYQMLQSRSLAARVIHDHGLEDDPAFTGAKEKPTLVALATRWLSSLITAATGWVHSASGTPATAVTDEQILGVEPASINAYLDALSVRPVFGTRLVTISFSSPHPALAAEITNAHVREFIRQNYTRHAQTSEEAQRYLGGKLSELESRTEHSEAALNSYRRERGIVEFSLDNKNQMINDELADRNRRVLEAEATRIGLEADLQTIKNRDYDSLPAVIDNELIQRLKEQSASLEGQYANLSNQYTPDYPPVAQLNAQLHDVQAREQAEVEKVVESIETRYNMAVERETELRRQLEQEKARAMALKDASLREAVLERDVQTNRTLYQSILERMKTLDVASESQMTNVTLVDPAETPRSPSSPKPTLTLVVSGFLALLSGLGIAFILEASDKGLKSADEVQSYLQLPNLASVVHFAVPNETDARSIKLLAERFDGADRLLVAGNAPISSRSLFALNEAYRAIRTGIVLSQSQRAPRTILFSSAIGGEGKSWTATNCAILFAQLHGRVLLIDADLRRARCHEILGSDRGPGLTEVLTGSQKLDQAIRSTELRGLFFLSAGQTPPNPTELLASQRMREILTAVISSYDHVLIDSPPILPVSDSVVLSTLVDGVIVVASAQTAKTLVRDACGRLMYVGSKMLGVVLTKVDPKRGREHLPYYSSYRYH
jgi:succinoglycan biosynthesis transport protein ExoP